jgi:hypothetical protein
VIHHVLSPYGYLPLDPSVEDYEAKVKIINNKHHFWTSTEFWVMSYAWATMNIDYIFMGFFMILYIIVDAIKISIYFENVLFDYGLMVFLSIIGIFIYCYNRQKISK